MIAGQLEQGLQLGQAGFEVSFFTRVGKCFCQAWHFFEQWQNGRILAGTVGRAEDAPLAFQEVRYFLKKYFWRIFPDVQALLERLVAGADFFSGFDLPHGEHDDGVGSLDRPLPDVRIARVVEPGGSEADDQLLAEEVGRVQGKLVERGAELRAKV
jgi:hypothetical protein